MMGAETLGDTLRRHIPKIMWCSRFGRMNRSNDMRMKSSATAVEANAWPERQICVQCFIHFTARAMKVAC
jgi:hypothetical protein